MVNSEENNDKYERFVLSEADLPEPPAGLELKVMRRIRQYERRMLILKTAGFGGLFAVSAGLVVAAYFNLMSAFAQSGFFDFTSLFFSDFGAAMANFQDFVFSTLEAFPVFSAAFLLGGVIVVIWSAVHFIDDVARIRAQDMIAIAP